MTTGSAENDVAMTDWKLWGLRLLGFLLLLGVGVLLWVFVPWFFRLAQGLQQEVAVSLVVGVATVAAFLWRRASEVREARRAHIQERKTDVYEEFLQFWFRVLLEGAKQKRQPSQKDLQAFTAKSVPGFILWASDDVIRAWNDLRARMAQVGDGAGAAGRDKARETLLGLEALMREMRQDVGHDLASLESGVLLNLFINDWPAQPPGGAVTSEGSA